MVIGSADIATVGVLWGAQNEIYLFGPLMWSLIPTGRIARY